MFKPNLFTLGGNITTSDAEGRGKKESKLSNIIYGLILYHYWHVYSSYLSTYVQRGCFITLLIRSSSNVGVAFLPSLSVDLCFLWDKDVLHFIPKRRAFAYFEAACFCNGNVEYKLFMSNAICLSICLSSIFRLRFKKCGFMCIKN